MSSALAKRPEARIIQPSRPRMLAEQAIALASAWGVSQSEWEIRKSAADLLEIVDNEPWSGIIAATKILCQAIVGFIDAGEAMRRHWGYVCCELTKLVNSELDREIGA